jgi:Tfp pilus assembly protein PilO
MRQSSKRLFSMLLSLIFLVAALIVLFDLIQPTYGDLQTLKGQQLSDENILASEQNIVSQAKNLIGQYQSESQAQSSLALAMPSGPNVASALAQIYGIAQANGITIQNIGISAPLARLQNTPSQGSSSSTAQVIKPVGTFSFQLTASGSYESLKNFLSEIETNIRVFDLTAFSIHSAAAAAPSGKGAPVSLDAFSYTFTFQTYYQAQ